MICLGDRCLSCIIDNIHSYSSFASLPSEACESILVLLKGKINMDEELLSKFVDCYLTSLDISNEVTLDYSLFMLALSSSPSSSTLHTLDVSYSDFDDEDMLLLSSFPFLTHLNVSHCDNITGASFHALSNLSSLNLRGCSSLDGSTLKYVLSIYIYIL